MKKLEIENSPKLQETLEEQRDYYLNLYQKWAKWQQETPEKLPIGFRTKGGFDFEKLIEKIKKDNFEEYFSISLHLASYYRLVNYDKEIKEIIFCEIIFLKYYEVFIRYLEITKPILLISFSNNEKYHNCIDFLDCTVKLYLIRYLNNEIKDNKFIPKFKNCAFSHITLENFDRGYFSPETNEYLNEMESVGKLTLVNCTWSGLPVLRENLEMEEIGKKIWEKKIILDEKNKPLKTFLHKHLAFFSDFVELTEGKKVQIRITSETQIILVEIFSFNGATSELIERKYYEFIDYSLNDEKNTSKINFSEKIDIITKFKSEGTIGFAKGMFFGEKQRIEEVEKQNFKLIDLANNS